MFVRAYLRASTVEQDALRAKAALTRFAEERGVKIAAFYTENASGATLSRPELMRLIEDAHAGDVLLVEQVDRLARLTAKDWEQLKKLLAEKELLVVSLDIPTTWAALEGGAAAADGVTAALQKALSAMLLDVLAAVARKDYDDRRRRQKEGIAKAKSKGVYKGREKDTARRSAVAKLLKSGSSYTEIQKTVSCSRTFIASVARELKSA